MIANLLIANWQSFLYYNIIKHNIYYRIPTGSSRPMLEALSKESSCMYD